MPDENNNKILLHFIDSLDYGGAETLIRNYIPLLPEYRHLVVVLTDKYQLENKGFDYINLNLQPKKDFFKIILNLRKLILKYKVCIVHSHSYWTNIISRIATPNSVKLINHYHFADYDTFKHKKSVKQMVLLDKLLFRKKLIRFSVSNYITKVLKYKFKNSQIITLPNFILYKKSNIINPISKTGILKMVAVGNCKPEKNYELILNVFKYLKNEPVSIDVYGGGSQFDFFCKEVKRLDLKNVSFLGINSNIPEVLPNYDLYVSTSISETFGISILEAVAASLPLMLSNIPAFIEIAESAATFFNPQKKDELLFEINKFIRDPKSVNIEEYKKIKAKYSQQNFLKLLRSVYES